MYETDLSLSLSLSLSLFLSLSLSFKHTLKHTLKEKYKINFIEERVQNLVKQHFGNNALGWHQPKLSIFKDITCCEDKYLGL